MGFLWRGWINNQIFIFEATIVLSLHHYYTEIANQTESVHTSRRRTACLCDGLQRCPIAGGTRLHHPRRLWNVLRPVRSHSINSAFKAAPLPPSKQDHMRIWSFSVICFPSVGWNLNESWQKQICVSCAHYFQHWAWRHAMITAR